MCYNITCEVVVIAHQWYNYEEVSLLVAEALSSIIILDIFQSFCQNQMYNFGLVLHDIFRIL